MGVGSRDRRVGWRALVAFLLAGVLTPNLGAQLPAGAVRGSETFLLDRLEQPLALPWDSPIGIGSAPIGDLDGDGFHDVALVGETHLWVLLLGPGAEVRSGRRHELVSFMPPGSNEFYNLLHAATALGDVNGDGHIDVAVSGGALHEAYPEMVLIVFLDGDGGLVGVQPIWEGVGGFDEVLSPSVVFGSSIAGLGDLDGDGIPDLAVGAPYRGFSTNCDPAQPLVGRIWVLFLNVDGTVREAQPIGGGDGGLDLGLDACQRFGSTLSWGGPGGAEGAPQLLVDRSWILTLESNGSVSQAVSIDLTSDELPEVGRVTWIGDVDRDGVDDLIGVLPFNIYCISATFGRWVTFLLNPDGTVKSTITVEDKAGPGLTHDVSRMPGLPTSLTSAPDQDGDGVREVLATSGGYELCHGAIIYDILAFVYLSDGFVDVPSRVSDNVDSLTVVSISRFGSSIAPLGDLDGDGRDELAIGSPQHDEDFPQNFRGSVNTLTLNQDGTAQGQGYWDHTSAGTLHLRGEFGSALCAAGDVDLDGVPDAFVGAPGAANDTGAVWFVPLIGDGNAETKVNLFNQLGLPPAQRPQPGDRFGSSVAVLGDVETDGWVELLVGAPGDGSSEAGELWALRFAAPGTVEVARRVDLASLAPALADGDRFGAALAVLGDRDGDGTVELAVGAPGDDRGGLDQGVVHVVSLSFDGLDVSVVRHHRLGAGQGGFPGELSAGDAFGTALAYGRARVPEGPSVLAVGSPGSDVGGRDQGAVWLLWPGDDGALAGPRHLRYDGTHPPFSNVHLDEGDALGSALAWLGDVSGTARGTLAIGAAGDGSDTSSLFSEERDTGAVWLVRPGAAQWSNLGHGLAGTTGEPFLVGGGSLTEGEAVELALTGAPPLSDAAIFAGTALLEQPFHGGVLVPRPDRILLGHRTDGRGMLRYEQVWRSLPELTAWVFQVWVADPGAPGGFAASNAVEARFR